MSNVLIHSLWYGVLLGYLRRRYERTNYTRYVVSKIFPNWQVLVDRNLKQLSNLQNGFHCKLVAYIE